MIITPLQAKAEELDNIAYALGCAIGGLTVLKLRILGAYPHKTYGYPPKILSKPFTASHANLLLEAQCKELDDVAMRLHKIQLEEGDIANL